MKNITNAVPADFERRKRLQEEVIRSVRQFRAANRLKRENVYARGSRRKAD